MTRIFLVAGGPAAGKSTTAAALAARFPKSVHIPVDAVRDLVVSGQALPGADWSQELVQQLVLARECAAYMALAYCRAGFAVVIDDFWDPNSGLAEYAALFSQPQVRKILLYPSREAARARNRQRSGSGAAVDYIDDGIRLVYEHLDAVVGDLAAQGWWVLDTTEMAVEDVVQDILVRAGIG
ncbi:MAG: AAA family ATPase [Anaerolineae bacterium]